MATPARASGSGRVVALFISPRRTYPMEARAQVHARTTHGFEDDAHARPGGSRQVLLLESETLKEFGVEPGALKENITTAGVQLAALEPGTRVQVGAARLEITKECAPCEEVDSVQPGLQEKLRGRRGMLARVLAGGPIQVGDPIAVTSGCGSKERSALGL